MQQLPFSPGEGGVDEAFGEVELAALSQILREAGQQIVQHAVEEQIDMIAMAARGAEALDRAVFGSTTYRVIQLGQCPVLAVHT